MNSANRLLGSALRFYLQHSPVVRGQGRMVHGWRSLWRGQERLARIPPGVHMSLDLSDYVQREIFFNGTYEPEVVSFVNNFLKSGMCFIDVGANVGQYTLIAAALVGREGRVYSFEPSRLNYERLTKNIALNEFPQITPERMALYDRCGEASFFAEEEENWGQSSLTAFESASVEQVVPLMTLDAYIEEHNIESIDLLKIDAEGAELPILQGATHMLSSCVPQHILCELNFVTCHRSGYHPNDIVTLLGRYGYQGFCLWPEKAPLKSAEQWERQGHVDAVFSL